LINTVCGFCGVGCGLVFENDKLKGIKNYPSNDGLICKKGSLQFKAVNNRVLNPLYRKKKEDSFSEISWDEAIKIIAKKIKNTNPKKIGFYLSGQLLNEDYYVANKLAKGFIKTNNVDTNSRLCMASAVVAYKKTIGSDYVLLTMQDALKANLLILVGANPASSHIVFFNKIKKAKKNGLKVIVVDPIYTDSAKIADLYIQIKPGSDIYFLNAVAKELIDRGYLNKNLNGLDKYLEQIKKIDIEKNLKFCDVGKEKFEAFIKLFIENENVVSAWTMGLNQSSSGVNKNIALINLHLISGKIFKPNNGPLSLTGQPNAMGGREVGGLATVLAVHLDYNKENVKKVEKFWNTKNIPQEKGLTAYEMITKGDLKFLLITHTDPVYHLPNRNLVEKSIKKIDFVVEINAYSNSESSKYANLILPALPWGEKEGTQTNLDRLISKVNPIRLPLKNAKADWEIFCLIAKELGFSGFDYKSAKDIFNEYKQMTKLSPDMNIFEANYDKLPFRWGKNLNKALTKNQKANIIFPTDNNLSPKTNNEYPFMLITFRLANHWHSKTKTSQFIDDECNYFLINEIKAKELNLKENQFYTIKSSYGKLKLKAKFANIYKDAVAIAMHYLKINYLVNDTLDPESFEPDFNITPVKIVVEE